MRRRRRLARHGTRAGTRAGLAVGVAVAAAALCAAGLLGAVGCGVPNVTFVDAGMDSSVAVEASVRDSGADADAGASDAGDAGDASAPASDGAPGDGAYGDDGASDGGVGCPSPAPTKAAVCCPQNVWCVGCMSSDCNACEMLCDASVGMCCLHGSLMCKSSCP